MTGQCAPLDTQRSPHALWRTLPVSAATLDHGFWASKQALNRERALAHGYRMLEEAGNLENLRIAAGRATGAFRGRVFHDTDVYKWLEALAYESSAAGSIPTELQPHAEEAINLIEAAQQPDGYLDTYYQLVEPDRRWTDLPHGHEMYCAGHLIQCAVAYHRCVGDGRLLTVARRFADYIDSVFGPERRQGLCGHPEIEMALVELYRETGERRYLKLSEYFVDQRGHGTLGPSPRFGGTAHYQDRVPVREASEIEGHAVRALYLACGITDVYLETGERALLDALLRQWNDMTSRKMYITGGTGSRHFGEGFGHAYELPNERAYGETCAAIGSIMWSWRLLLATRDARFADLIEHTLYNGFLSGLSQSGDRFFYTNPLLSRGEPILVGRGARERLPWHTTACCPPNIMRLLASLSHYVASTDDTGVQIHQYMSGSVSADFGTRRHAAVRMETDYPWDSRVELTITTSDNNEWELRLRVPAWCQSATLEVNGESAPVQQRGGATYASLRRRWQVGDRVSLTLPMAARLVEAHPRVDAARDCVAIQRGPMVYCIEQVDHTDASVLDVEVDSAAPLQEAWQPDLLGGMTTIRASGRAIDESAWGGSLYSAAGAVDTLPRRDTTLTAIPYYAWANRGPAAMRVWIPRAQ